LLQKEKTVRRRLCSNLFYQMKNGKIKNIMEIHDVFYLGETHGKSND